MEKERLRETFSLHLFQFSQKTFDNENLSEGKLFCEGFEKEKYCPLIKAKDHLHFLQCVIFITVKVPYTPNETIGDSSLNRIILHIV